MSSLEMSLGLIGAGAWAAIASRQSPTVMDEFAWRARSARLPLGIGLLAVALFMFVSATFAMASLQWVSESDKTQYLRVVFAANLASGVAIVAVLTWLLYAQAIPFEVVTGDRVPMQTVAAEALRSLATWLPLALVVHAIARFVWPQEAGRENLIEQALVQPQPWDVRVLAALCAVVRAPVAEELAFRGFLIVALAGPFGVWQACVVAAAAFAAVHSSWPDPLPLAVVGVMFGSAYVRTGSLAAPIAAHALYNGVMTLVALLAPNRA